MTNKIVFIPGGIAGIGRATARAFAAQGATVFVTSRTAPPGIDANGIEVLNMEASSEESVAATIAAIIAKAGRIDVLVYSIGLGMMGAAEEQSIADGATIMETNFWGAVRTIKATLPLMRGQGGGHIIAMSSAGGFMGFPYSAFYSASKFALSGYCEALQLEVKPFNIHVSIIEPAGVLTHIVGNVPLAATRLPAYAETRARLMESMNKMMKSGLAPEAVAKVILGVASTANPGLRFKVGGPAKGMATMARFAPEPVKAFITRKMLDL
jgi:NAD(P)-dependent dehydrogenase (short-subunit alcohol dehydrogenase family)